MSRPRSWQMGLPLPVLLALRYLRSTRRDAYVTVLSLFAVCGITVGVWALVLVLACLAGLQHFLRSDVLARTPHLEVELPPATDFEAVLARLRAAEGVREARRLLRGRGWLVIDGRTVEVRVVGFEGRLPRFFSAATDDRPGLYVGDLLTGHWGLEPGDLVDLVSPRPTLTPFGPQPRLHRLRIAGIFHTGRTEDRTHRIAVPLDTARRLFGDRGIRIELRTEGFAAALRVAEQIEPLLPAGSQVRSWKDLNRGLFFALKLEKRLMFVSVSLIVTVAVIPLATVLALLISSKRGEIGILKAMGARPAALRRAFFLLGSIQGVLGLVLGCSVGVGTAWLLDRYRLVSPPGGVYFIDYFPFRVEAGDLLAVVLATVLLTAGSTAYASHRAALMGAVEALRQ